MWRPKTFEEATEQWMDDAIRIGDPRLIEAVSKIGAKPQSISEHLLYSHIESGDTEKLRYMLENFIVTCGRKSLTRLSVAVSNKEAFINTRESSFQLLLEHGVDRVFKRLTHPDEDIEKLLDYRAIANKAEHLGFADAFFEAMDKYGEFDLDDMFSLVTLPRKTMNPQQQHQYASFYKKWISKAKRDLNAPLSKKVILNLVSILINLNDESLFDVVDPLIGDIKEEEWGKEANVNLNAISDIALIKKVMTLYPHIKLSISTGVIEKIDAYLLSEDAEEVAWLYASIPRPDDHLEVAMRLYTVAQKIVKLDVQVQPRYRKKLNEVIKHIAKLTNASSQENITQFFGLYIERNCAIEAGKHFVKTLVSMGNAMMNHFLLVHERFNPVIGTLAVLYADDVDGFREEYVQQALKYENRSETSLILKIGRSKDNTLRDRLHSNHSQLIKKWRETLPLRLESEADVLKTVLRKDLKNKDAELSLLSVLSSKSIIEHMNKTTSSNQREVLMNVTGWNGLDVIKKAKQFGVSLSKNTKTWLMGELV